MKDIGQTIKLELNKRKPLNPSFRTMDTKWGIASNFNPATQRRKKDHIIDSRLLHTVTICKCPIVELGSLPNLAALEKKGDENRRHSRRQAR